MKNAIWQTFIIFILGFFYSGCQTSKIIELEKNKTVSYGPTSNFESRKNLIDKSRIKKIEAESANLGRSSESNRQDFEKNKKNDKKKVSEWASIQSALEQGRLQEAFLLAKSTFSNFNDDMLHSEQRKLSEDEKFAYLAIARTFAHFEDYRSTAVNIYTKIIDSDAKAEEAYSELAALYARQESYVLAADILKTCLDVLDKPQEKTFFELAQYQKKSNQLKLATQTVALAKINYPDSRLSDFWEAVVEFENGSIHKACSTFQDVFPKMNKFSSVAYNLVLCSIRENDLDKASELLKSSFIKFPDEPSFKLLAGIVAQKKGNKSNAKRFWNEYLLSSDKKDLNLKINNEIKKLL